MTTSADINKTLGERLRNIRMKKRITREALAEKIDVSTRFLADVESGKVGISLVTLRNICRYLGVSSDYLLGLAETGSEYSEKAELINRVSRADEKYIQSLNKIVTAFLEATEI